MNSQWSRTLFVIAAVVFCCVGCGGPASKNPTTAAPATKPTTPLPEWAPKNPSAEFLRAAKVLKSMPEELVLQLAKRVGHENPEIVRNVLMMFWPSAWEFFGTMTDKQVERFVTTGSLHIPMGDLSKKQRAALDRFITSYDKANQSDTLVNFYKRGARKDLSNVAVGFGTEAHIVVLRLLVRDANSGKDSPIDNIPIAVL